MANAGVHYVGAFEKTPLEVLERELEINLLGVLRTDHVVLPHLLRSRGYLLNIASLAAASHAPLMTSYAASKAGVEGLSNSLRAELAPRGVGVGCAYFGFIDTDMVRDAFAHPSTTAMLPLLPPFVRRPVPVERAVDAIERGIRGRRARMWAPRYVGLALASRGWLQPLTEARVGRSRRIEKALIADRSAAAGRACGRGQRRTGGAGLMLAEYEVAIVGSGLRRPGHGDRAKALGHRRTSSCSSAAMRWEAPGVTTATPAAPATFRRRSTRTRSRPIRTGRTCTRAAASSAPTSKTARTGSACASTCSSVPT